jgi:6-phospho-beta-glucosidase
MKVSVLGCGLRTPLLLHGLVRSNLRIDEIALYDIDGTRAELMMEIGRQIADGASVRVAAAPILENAIEGCEFVISSIRVGNMETRARDERLSLECGFAGQETTGPAGFAMALRTIPVALQHAGVVERRAPKAWIINFTNPAGIITQAISTHSGAKVVGICDTPAELFHQIARALGEAPEDVQCEYFGLNHLGWVRSVRVRGEDVIDRLVDDEQLLKRLYPTELFSPDFIRCLRLIPTEYLFFYYNQQAAAANQRLAGATRGEELDTMNRQIWTALQGYIRSGDAAAALSTYRRYLNRRNASYMRLDGAGGSAFQGPDPDWDPFEGATGYHRIAVDTIKALSSVEPRSLVLNVPNQGCIEGLAAEYIVEAQCVVNRTGPRPLAVAGIPVEVRGLIFSVKEFERLAVRAAVEARWDVATFALTMNPIVGSWDGARKFLARLAGLDEPYFSNFTGSP